MEISNPADFQTAKPPHFLLCHQEFLEKLEENRNHPLGKRTALILQRMSVDPGRLHYKATHGANRGWRRSRLGGGGGSHFYAWWAPKGAPPVKAASGVAGVADGAIFLRDIRHHDDHSPLPAGDPGSDYLPMTVPEIRNEIFAPSPWTPVQARFAKAKGVARVLRGHPGSGKTTALLHAADLAGGRRVLYLTFSTDLAALARDYFDRYCAASREFTVLTYPDFIRQLTRTAAPPANDDAKARFRRDLAPHGRAIGPWGAEIPALYDEFHAHLIGAALPEAAGWFAKAERVRLPEAAYRSQRAKYLGPQLANFALDAANRLDRADPAPLADRYFPELALAWRAAHALASSKTPNVNPAFLEFDCIAVDECQDLTPLESYVVAALARRLNAAGAAPLLIAGDEAQTVRPTDFEWAWLNGILHSTVATPLDFHLAVNLRSPRRIATLVNRVWDLYRTLDKQDRPSGSGYAEIEDDSPDQVIYATVSPAGLEPLIEDLAQREGAAIIAMEESAVPERLKPYVLTPVEAKGLDFHTVCVLEAGPALRRLVDQVRHVGSPADPVRRRLTIDKLRVALSRPTERLIWVDVNPPPDTVGEVKFFLREPGEHNLPPVTAEALIKTLGEEDLDREERIQRCRHDARQLVAVKPDLAWSRAQQAVGLLGAPKTPGAVEDETVRQAAFETLSEVCFQLAFRKAKLAPELGNPELFVESAVAARRAGNAEQAEVISMAGDIARATPANRAESISIFIQGFTAARAKLDSWFAAETAPRAEEWIAELERLIPAGDNGLAAVRTLPGFFEAAGLPGAKERADALCVRAIQQLIKNKRWTSALEALKLSTKRLPKLEAEVHEELSNYSEAGALYRETGEPEKALRCYRQAADFQRALEMVREIGEHPARESLEWLHSLTAVIGTRPEKFARVMTMPEK